MKLLEKKLLAKWLPMAAMVALYAGIPAAAQEDGGVQSIIGQMDKVLRNDEGRGSAEVETAIAALNRSLRQAALEEQDEDAFDAGESELRLLEVPSAIDDGGGESGSSEESSSDEAAGDSGGGEDYPPGGQDPADGDDGSVFGINDGSGSDEPDMGICDQGGEPAWCIDSEPGDEGIADEAGGADMPLELVSDFDDGAGGEFTEDSYGDGWNMDDVWDLDSEVVVNSNDGLGTDEPDQSICDQGGEPAWCGEGD